jgi:hypothetical protein
MMDGVDTSGRGSVMGPAGAHRGLNLTYLSLHVAFSVVCDEFAK